MNFDSLCDLVYGCHNDRIKLIVVGFCSCLHLNKIPVEKTSSEYRFGILSLTAVIVTNVNYH